MKSSMKMLMVTILTILGAFLSACTSGSGSGTAYKYKMTGTYAFIPAGLSAMANPTEQFTLRWNEAANGTISGVFTNDTTKETIRMTGISNNSGRVFNGTLPAAIGQATKIRLTFTQTGPLNGAIQGTVDLLDNSDATVGSSFAITAIAETSNTPTEDEDEDEEEDEDDSTPGNIPAALAGTWDRWITNGCGPLGVTDTPNALIIVNQSNPISHFHHVSGLGTPGNMSAYFNPDNGYWFLETSYNSGETTYLSRWNPASPSTITMMYNKGGSICTGSYTKHVEPQPTPTPTPTPEPLGTWVGSRTCTGGTYDGATMEVTLVVANLPTSGNPTTATLTLKKNGSTVHGPNNTVPFETYTFEPNYSHIASAVITTDSNTLSWSFTAKYRPGMDNFHVNDLKETTPNNSNCSNLVLTRQ